MASTGAMNSGSSASATRPLPNPARPSTKKAPAMTVAPSAHSRLTRGAESLALRRLVAAPGHAAVEVAAHLDVLDLGRGDVGQPAHDGVGERPRVDGHARAIH